MTKTHLLQTARDTFNRLRELTEARDSLPMDWGRWNALFGDITDADSPEDLEARAVAATIGACTRPGMTEQQARTVSDLLAALADAEAGAADMPDAALCALLRELVVADDLPGLELALFKLARYDGRAYVEKLQALADATDPSEPNDPERLRAEQVKALQASATPGTVLDDELACTILDALNTWHAIKSETPQQRAIREAFAHARTLMDLHGEGDSRTFDAVIKAIELQDPGCCSRMLAESGFRQVNPDRCTDDGTPLFSLDAVADALGADPEELLVKARELECFGLGTLHTTHNTHALQ